VTVTNRRKL